MPILNNPEYKDSGLDSTFAILTGQKLQKSYFFSCTTATRNITLETDLFWQN